MVEAWGQVQVPGCGNLALEPDPRLDRFIELQEVITTCNIVGTAVVAVVKSGGRKGRCFVENIVNPHSDSDPTRRRTEVAHIGVMGSPRVNRSGLI